MKIHPQVLIDPGAKVGTRNAMKGMKTRPGQVWKA
jgi:hypothetical protein